MNLRLHAQADRVEKVIGRAAHDDVDIEALSQAAEMMADHLMEAQALIDHTTGRALVPA